MFKGYKAGIEYIARNDGYAEKDHEVVIQQQSVNLLAHLVEKSPLQVACDVLNWRVKHADQLPQEGEGEES